MINMRNNSDIPNILTSLVANTQSPNHFYRLQRAAGGKETHCWPPLFGGHTSLIIAQELARTACKLVHSTRCKAWIPFFFLRTIFLPPRVEQAVSLWDSYEERRKWGWSGWAQGGDHFSQVIYLLNRVEESKRDAIHRRRHEFADDDVFFAQPG